MRHYGRQGYIDVQDTQLSISMEEPLRGGSGTLMRTTSVELSEIVGASLKESSRTTTGSLRLDLRSMDADNESRPNGFTLEFDHSERKQFRRLHSWLISIAAINHHIPTAGNAASSKMPDGGIDTSEGRHDAYISQVPQTPAQRADLISLRPHNWEHRLFASVLVERRDVLEPKWRDHELRYKHLGGMRFDDQSAVRYLPDALSDASAIAVSVDSLLSNENWMRAFGEPGTPGDPLRIEHLALRLVGLYEACLDWAANLRSARVSDNLAKAFDLASRMIDPGIDAFRRLIADFVYQIESLPDIKQSPNETITISMTLVFQTDDLLMKEFEAELARAAKRFNT